MSFKIMYGVFVINRYAPLSLKDSRVRCVKALLRQEQPRCYFMLNSSFSSFTPTSTVIPGVNAPEISNRESGVSSSWIIARFKGRAPKSGS